MCKITTPSIIWSDWNPRMLSVCAWATEIADTPIISMHRTVWGWSIYVSTHPPLPYQVGWLLPALPLRLHKIQQIRVFTICPQIVPELRKICALVLPLVLVVRKTLNLILELKKCRTIQPDPREDISTGG